MMAVSLGHGVVSRPAVRQVACRAAIQQKAVLSLGPSLSGRKSQTAGSLRGKLWPQQQAARQLCKPVQAEEAVQLDPLESAFSKVLGPKAATGAVTAMFVAFWYALNVFFNLQNKTIFNYFPYPWTVSAVHVVVGLLYCTASYFLGFRKASFGRPITGAEFKTLFGPASMHALGHIAANLSFAAVAISLTHTVKTLEPAFSVVLSKLILGQSTPLPVVATLAPIMAGVALASAAELSFNWLGFLSAMMSNITFGFRAVWSKQVMGNIKDLDSTALYAYTTLVSVLICVPAALVVEGKYLSAGIDKALAKNPNFYWALLSVGLLYHLYNQFAFNTLSRVSPVSHGVANVVKRVVIIGTSVVFFGTTLTPKTKAGTVIALIGTYLYTEMSKRHKPAPKKFISSDGQPAGPDLGSPGKGTTGGNTGGGI